MQKLSKDEMKKVIGGVAPPSDCSAQATNCDSAKCSCSGSGTNACGASDNAAECNCNGTITTVTCPS